jgi:SAM-dependent methyltransferase
VVPPPLELPPPGVLRETHPLACSASIRRFKIVNDWSLEIKNMSWVEHTREEVDFIVNALQLRGNERVLDLACGFGRHTLELARRGYAAVGVDITSAYIADAQSTARQEHLAVEFFQSDVRNVLFENEFDLVLNMADGAIGYFETDEENLKLFDVIGRALRFGGKHVMGLCSATHAKKHFPKRHWEAGLQSLSLADFRWNAATSRMLYQGRTLKYGESLKAFPNEFSASGDNGTRLYTLDELRTILHQRGLKILAAYGAYDTSIPASEDRLMQVICSRKEQNAA